MFEVVLLKGPLKSIYEKSSNLSLYYCLTSRVSSRNVEYGLTRLSIKWYRYRYCETEFCGTDFKVNYIFWMPSSFSRFVISLQKLWWSSLTPVPRIGTRTRLAWCSRTNVCMSPISSLFFSTHVKLIILRYWRIIRNWE